LRGCQVRTVDIRFGTNYVGFELVALHPRLGQFNFTNVSNSQSLLVDVHDSVQLGQTLIFGLQHFAGTERIGVCIRGRSA